MMYILTFDNRGSFAVQSLTLAAFTGVADKWSIKWTRFPGRQSAEVVVGLGNRLRASALLSVVPGLCRIVFLKLR